MNQSIIFGLSMFAVGIGIGVIIAGIRHDKQAIKRNGMFKRLIEDEQRRREEQSRIVTDYRLYRARFPATDTDNRS